MKKSQGVSIALPEYRKFIDTSAWTDDNKAGFQTSMTSLKMEIDNYLNPPLR